MIKKHSDDPDVESAAHEAAAVVRRVLHNLPPAKTFDYGGHRLNLDEYGMCTRCTSPIAEAQQAHDLLLTAARGIVDPTVKEHVALAAELFRLEAQAAVVRAELHSGHGSEGIVNEALGFIHHRSIGDNYDHSHHGSQS
jgi:hypothetical protein